MLSPGQIIMSQLSKYIQKQLTSIIAQIDRTPPRKCASLAKIRVLVQRAPISPTEKLAIDKSIKRVESAMLLNNKAKKAQFDNPHAKNLFYQNLLLDEKGMNSQKKTVKNHNKSEHVARQQSRKGENSKELNELLQKLETVRNMRLNRQKYLHELIIKTQRMERLLGLKIENQDKYLESKMLAKNYQQSKARQAQAKKQIQQAVRKRKVRSIYSLVGKAAQDL